MDKFRDIVCVLCIECAGMILRHIVNDECRHLLGVVHACAIVEGVWSPHGGQDWRDPGTIGSATGNVISAVALGAVGTGGVAYLEVGGLVGQNHGAIGNAIAKSDVTTGDNGVAGGLTGNSDFGPFGRRGRQADDREDAMFKRPQCSGGRDVR